MKKITGKMLCFFMALPLFFAFAHMPVSYDTGFEITASAEEDENAPDENEEPPEENTDAGTEDEPADPGEEDTTEGDDPPEEEPTDDESDNSTGGGDETEETRVTEDGDEEDDEDSRNEGNGGAGGAAGTVRHTVKTKAKTKTSSSVRTSVSETTAGSGKVSDVPAVSAPKIKESASASASVNTAAVSAVVVASAAVCLGTAVLVSKQKGRKTEYDPGEETDDQNCPYGAEDFNSRYGKYNACALTDSDDRIIFTFDPEYDKSSTERILDVLKEKKVSAVFFLTGNCVKKQDALIDRMVNEGHMLGNYGMTGSSMPDMKTAPLRENIAKLHDYVLQKFGFEMLYLRPPFGEFSKKTLALTRDMGYTTLMWSFDVERETGDLPDKTSVIEKMISSAHGGGIYLFRSVSDIDTEMLGDVIDILRDKGFVL